MNMHAKASIIPRGLGLAAIRHELLNVDQFLSVHRRLQAFILPGFPRYNPGTVWITAPTSGFTGRYCRLTEDDFPVRDSHAPSR